MPIIVVAGIFDALRLFFEWFVFFGPALAGTVCAAYTAGKISSWTFGLLGSGSAVALCAAGATALGVVGAEVTTPFGIVMADAVGLLGFLVLLGLIVATNARLFKVNKSGLLMFAGSLGLVEIPLVGSLPGFSVALFFLYRRQIKVETTARERWEKEQAERQAFEREQQIAALMQISAAQEEQEAANEEIYEQEAQDEEIPEALPKAA